MNTAMRNMHVTMDLQEQIEIEREKQSPTQNDKVHYWQVERKTRRGGWKFHSNHYCTKSEISRCWKKFFLGNREYRLRHLLTY